MKRVLISLMFVVFFVVVSCGKTSVNSNNTGDSGTKNTGNTGDLETGDTGNNFLNKHGGLKWSKKAPKSINWSDAKKYCENLVEDGYSDWRLPTISELRTLIKNCPATETGGECGVTDSCLSLRNCRNDACSGCSGSSDGKYSKLGDTECFWSFSEESDHAGFAWYVRFSNGYVSNDSDGNDKHYEVYVRCVK